jgi:hypothetical protein
MAKRSVEQGPTPLQERYYRSGLNAGAVSMLKRAYAFGIERELALELEEHLTRISCRGVVAVPQLSPEHPMAAWAPKKRRGR